MLPRRITAFGALLLLAACTGIIGEGAASNSADGGAPGPSAASAQAFPLRRLRRLSSREYNNVVRDLLGDSSQPANQFVRDAYSNGYDNGSAGLAVQSDQAEGYQAAAEALASTAVSNHLSALLAGCDVAQQGAAACLDSFLGSFAPRAYRRPLTATELQRLRDAYTAGAATAGGFAVGVQTALEVILQSPQFLYREELGPEGAAAAAGTQTQMTDYEAASELSFLLTGSIPDAELWSAVGEGRFVATADRVREATRLLGTDTAKATLRSFMHQWMTTDRLPSLSKDPTFYPAFGPAMASSMSAELDQFYDGVLWGTGDGSLRDMFTSSSSYVDPTLAKLYGVKAGPAGTAPAGTALQSVALDPTIRRGILSRAGFLAVHSDVDSSGPIARGVFALQSILCSPPPPPPGNVPPAVAANDPSVKNITTRQRFAGHVSSSFCASCHTTIDGIGFGFEEFDGIGAYRTTENGLPVDSSGTIVGTGEIDGPYDGVAQLAEKVAGSRHLVDCYVRQAYRYAMGQIESNAALEELGASFTADARLTRPLLDIVSAPMFVTRLSEGHGEAAQ